MFNNAFLAEAARQGGLRCKPFPFGLCLPADQSNTILSVLQACVARLVDSRLSQQVPVERHADPGPYFRSLSDSLQKEARHDWLDHEFLKRWVDQITDIELVELNSDLGQDLVDVIKP